MTGGGGGMRYCSMNGPPPPPPQMNRNSCIFTPVNVNISSCTIITTWVIIFPKFIFTLCSSNNKTVVVTLSFTYHNVPRMKILVRCVDVIQMVLIENMDQHYITIPSINNYCRYPGSPMQKIVTHIKGIPQLWLYYWGSKRCIRP